ncbi:MAG TPA: glycosyltransferase family 39 protein [Anaerolineae bacterium]|nr:glycosyltransferase family 39 protein [Anaerolineae bacterium]
MNRSLVSRVLPFVIIGCGFGLRLYHLGANSLWYDETVSLLLARSDLTELIRHTAGDIHPPFYYLLLHIWVQLAGWSEFSSAFLSLWFGVFLIALVYGVAREWFTPMALLAAFLVAISPYNIWYSQEVRMYTLGAMLGLLSVFFFRRMVVQRKWFTRDFFAYVIFTALGIYTLYYFVFLIVFEWVYLGFVVWREMTEDGGRRTEDGQLPQLLITFVLSQVAWVLLYLPWLPIAVRQATDPPVPPWRQFIGLPQVLLESFSALVFGQSVDPSVVLPMLAVIGVGIALVLLKDRDWRYEIENQKLKIENPISPWFLFGYTFIPLAAIFLFSLWKPLYHVRYIFTYSPAFYMLAAYTLVELGAGVITWRQRMSRTVATASVIVAALLGVVFLGTIAYSLNNFWCDPQHSDCDPQYADDDLRGAVGFIADHWRPGDVILVNAGYAYPAIAYYFPEETMRERLPNYQSADGVSDLPLVLETGSIGRAANLGWGDPRSDFYATTAEETRAALNRVVSSHPRVWVLRIYDTVVDPDGVIRQYLSAHGTMIEDQGFTGESQVRVQGYLTNLSENVPPNAIAKDDSLGERVKLVGVELPSEALQAGSFYDVVLYWMILDAVNYNYQLSVQVLDSSGGVVAQQDETPLGDALPMTRWHVGQIYREPVRITLPKTLTAGDYKVIAKLYNLRDTAVLGQPVTLGVLKILPQ